MLHEPLFKKKFPLNYSLVRTAVVIYPRFDWILIKLAEKILQIVESVFKGMKGEKKELINQKSFQNKKNWTGIFQHPIIIMGVSAAH